MAVHRKKDGGPDAAGAGKGSGNENPFKPADPSGLVQPTEDAGVMPLSVVSEPIEPEPSTPLKLESGGGGGAVGKGDGGSGKGGGGDSGGSGAGKGKPGGDKGRGKGKNEPKGIAQALQFIREVLVEFRKVTWPDRRQVFRETWSVLFLVAAITLMVLGFDWLLSHLVFNPIESWARMHGGGIGRGY
jgi:preprotein translocase subunit SecE